MKSIKTWLTTIVLLLCSLTVSAHSFEVDGIYYKITSSTDLTVAVTYKGDSEVSYREYSGSITIPTTVTYGGLTYSVTSIGYQAFSWNKDLFSITIPESVTSIESFAFYLCRGLTNINIYEGVTSIGKSAFCDCSSLTSIAIPESVTSIEREAFSGCTSLTSITFPENVTSIGENAISSIILTSATCKATTPPMISSNTFHNVTYSETPVYVPAGSVEAYKAAEGWSKFENILPLTNEYSLTISSAGYATLYLDYAVAIPEEVEVYIASSVEGDRLLMTEVKGVLPANTGVIVRAKEGTYTFVESDGTPADVEGSMLTGTTTSTYITAAPGYKYYVLAQKEGVVGMYRPKLTNGQFLNNANKAYLALESSDLGIFDDETNTEDEGGQLSNRLRFDFGGTTGIDNSEIRNHDSEIIFDLSGRRVTHPAKGIYIVGGKKVVIK